MHGLIPILGIACVSAMAQAPASATFEVASLKLSGPNSVRGSDGGPGSKDPGRYSFGQATVRDFIMGAYQVDPFQISSKAPLEQQRFDLVAKLPDGATKDQFRAMMRNLLSERFHLKAHMETKEFPAYELVVAKSGLKLTADARPPRQVDGFPSLPPDRPGLTYTMSTSGGYTLVRLRAQQQPLSALVRSIRLGDDSPVVDKTGVPGTYDFIFEYARPLMSASTSTDPPPAADLFDALQRQLGLQLVAKRLPFDVVVVESVDKLPTEN
jgi:uncharacterized protein (TIGR03435 family)